MRIIVLSTDGCRLLRRLKEWCDNYAVEFVNYEYDKFYYENGKIYYEKEVFSGFLSDDVVWFRWDSVEVNDNLFMWVRVLVDNAVRVGARVIDRWYWSVLPHYRDKYIQAIVFSEANISHVETWLLDDFIDQKKKVSGTMLIKQRMGGKGVGSRVVVKQEEIVEFVNENDSSEYVIQFYKKLRRDLRVMVINGKVIGVLERTPKIKDDKSVVVKTKDKTTLTEKEKIIVDRYIKRFGVEFCGLDVLTNDDGSVWVTEGNYSPLFAGFERLTNIDVIKETIEFFLTI